MLTSVSTVYSLENAAKEIARRNRGKSGDVDHPVDVLGIVTDHYSVGTSSILSKHIRRCLHIIDSSTSALVTLKGDQQLEDIDVGDIIRCNRVSLRIALDYSGGEQNLVHFHHHPFDSPEAGPEWFRLGHVRRVDGIVVNKPTFIPPSMQTDQASLSRLIDWYLTTDHFHRRSFLLSPLPHRRRSLEELLSCVGSMGEICARVDQIVDPPAAQTTTSCLSSRKRRRGTCRVAPGFAILSAPTATITPTSTKKNSNRTYSFATLLDPEQKVFTNLRKAYDSKCPVRITHVRSQNANHLVFGSNARMTEETVLIVTEQTRLTILPSTWDGWRGVDRKSGNGVHETKTSSQLTFHQTESSSSVSSSFEYYPKSAFPFLAHIESIAYIQQTVSIAAASNNSPTQLGDDVRLSAEAILDILSHGFSEQDVTFKLSLTGDAMGDVQVLANHQILLRLCGGIEPSALGKNSRFYSRSIAFLKAVLRDKVILQWKLKPSEGLWEVESVNLTSLTSK